MWQDIAVLGMMMLCGVVPFGLGCFLVLRGQVGAALTLLALIGAALAIALFASVRPFGVDPLQAIIAGLLFLAPAAAGATAGVILGWLIQRRRDRM
jgi:hypothetical protein